MHTIYSDKRKSGVPLVGNLSWGTNFCQFYQTENDLLEILVPYFKAGLESNELCVWITSKPIGAEDARKALEKALPHFTQYIDKGQIDIISQEHWRTHDGTREAIVSKLDKAISSGFDGLRLACNGLPENRDGKVFTDGVDVISRYNIIAVFSYPRDRFDAVSLMEVVKNHRFALVRNADCWELIESSEVRSVKDALKRSEEKLHSLFSNMSEGFAYHRIVLDAESKPCDYVFHEVNEAFERLTSLKGENIIGKQVTKVLPGIENDPIDWIGIYGQVALTGKPAHFESYSEPLKKWFSVSAFSPHKGYFAVTFSDITERKRMEQALLDQREWLQVTLSSIGDAVIATDTGGRITFMNPIAARLTGWPIKESLGRSIQSVVRTINEITGEPAEDVVTRVLTDGCIVNMANDTALITRNGKTIPIEDSAAPIKDSSGNVVGVVFVFHDVTEKRRAQASLRDSESRFRLLSETAGRLLVTDDPQGIVEDLCHEVMVHLDCQIFFNFLVDEEAGRLHLNACAGIPDEEAEKIQWLDYGAAVCGRVARHGERIIAEDIGNTHDSRTDLVKSYGIKAYACHPLMVQEKVVGTLSFGTRTRSRFSPEDLALMQTVADNVATAIDRIRLIQELQRSRDELELRVDERTTELEQRARQLSRLASELTLAEERERRRLGAILHDSLQPLLVAAKMNTEILSYHMDTPQKPTIENIVDLITQSIKVSRSLNAGLSLPSLQHNGLSAGLKWLGRWMERTHGLTVDLLVDPLLDPKRDDYTVLLFQSVRELLFNVVKHAGVTAAQVHMRKDEEGRHCIVVSDQGDGLDSENIWENANAGTGFGLLSIRERMTLMGGRFKVESEPGVGASFWLIMPPERARPSKPERPEIRVSPARPVVGQPPVSDVGDKIRVMLVDDHEVMRNGLSSLLGINRDIEIVGEVSDGLQAVRQARKILPDVILMDINMPKMDGLEATRRIHAEFPHIRIIVISMYEDQTTASAALNAGAVAFLTKSGSTDRLLAEIRDEAF